MSHLHMNFPCSRYFVRDCGTWCPQDRPLYIGIAFLYHLSYSVLTVISTSLMTVTWPQKCWVGYPRLEMPQWKEEISAALELILSQIAVAPLSQEHLLHWLSRTVFYLYSVAMLLFLSVQIHLRLSLNILLPNIHLCSSKRTFQTTFSRSQNKQ